MHPKEAGQMKLNIIQLLVIILVAASLSGLGFFIFGTHIGELNYYNKVKDYLPEDTDAYDTLFENYINEILKNHWYQYYFSYDNENHYLELETWSNGMTYIFFTGDDCGNINISTFYFEEYRNESYDNRWEIYLTAGTNIIISFDYETGYDCFDILLHVIHETEDFMGQKYPLKTEIFEVKT